MDCTELKVGDEVLYHDNSAFGCDERFGLVCQVERVGKNFVQVNGKKFTLRGREFGRGHSSYGAWIDEATEKNIGYAADAKAEHERDIRAREVFKLIEQYRLRSQSPETLEAVLAILQKANPKESAT